MKAIMKEATINNYNEEGIAFAQTIDFTELFTHVKDFTKINCSFYQPEITTNRCGDVFINFMSDDITPQTGPFAVILKSCCIHGFSNGIYKDKENGELYYWVIVHITYEHKNGGSNGMEIVRAWHHNGGWEFVDAGQNR